MKNDYTNSYFNKHNTDACYTHTRYQVGIVLNPVDSSNNADELNIIKSAHSLVPVHIIQKIWHTMFDIGWLSNMNLHNIPTLIHYPWESNVPKFSYIG